MKPKIALGRGFLAAALFFAFSIIAGWFFAHEAEPLLQPGLEQLFAAAEKSAEVDPQFRWAALAAFIFFKNLSVAAILVLIGHVLFALPTMFILLVNGALLGFVFAQADLPPMAFVAGIAPHGVFELPALLLAAGFALAVSTNRIRRRPVPGLTQRLGFLLRTIAPLLIIAAVLEVYVTPLVLVRFLS